MISDDLDLVQKLLEWLRESFMEKCKEFMVSFVESNISILPQKLLHNGREKESDEELADVISRILDSLNNS
ncbi:hypothetical protein C1645_827855 [Glomus cerebriforme]|uniref:Uncharacterized protein n=1 Tax=Glomus cerebriforme TaxID=658196 RepID=A0A397SRZ3_9GLOM|nr:hypothetical protein C1645_827855 [Glomus cerebriforme]